MFSIMFSANFNILSFITGSSGPVFFSLGVKDSLLVILVVNLMCVTHKTFDVHLYFSSFLLEHVSFRPICAFSKKGNKSCFKIQSFPTLLLASAQSLVLN